MAEYRIDFTIMVRRGDDEDFTEHAFGSTWAESSIDAAAHMVLSALQNGEYDITESGGSGSGGASR